MRIVQPHLMAEIDRLAQEEYGISGLLLMENAGIKAFQEFLREWNESDRAVAKECDWLQRQAASLLFIAGGGNNGGDALVMARQAFITGGFQVRVLLRGNKLNEQMQVHYKIVLSLGIPVTVWEDDPQAARAEIERADVLFDGISGTGIKGPLRGSAAEMVTAVNEAGRGFVVAIDVPSGLSDTFLLDYPAVKADLTLTMGLPKVPLYTPAGRPFAGKISTIRLGFPPQLLNEPPQLEGVLHGRLIEENGRLELRPQDYKNVRGHAALWAGSVGTTGAAALAAEGAARAGAGLVTLFCDQDIYPILAGKLSEIMVRPWGEPDAQLQGRLSVEELAARFTALLAGPGWGSGGREETLESLLQSGVPGVIDADGIHVFRSLWNSQGAGTLQTKTSGQWILTPHPGEYLALVKGSRFEIDKPALLGNPLESVAPVARELQVTVVLKSHVVWIIAPDGEFAVVDGMNPAMGTGGSGDVLAGVITGILAGGLPPFEAAWRGAALHQAAGQLAYDTDGWFLAGDLAKAVSQIRRVEPGQRIE